QPIERLRLIQWTLLACLLAPLVNQLPGMPRWSLAVATNVAEPSEPQRKASTDDVQSKASVHEDAPQTIALQEIRSTEVRSNEPTIKNTPRLDHSFDATPITHRREKRSVSSPAPLAAEQIRTPDFSAPSPPAGE